MTDEGICYSFNSFDVTDIYTEIVPKNEFDEVDKVVTWDVDDGYPKEVNHSIMEYPRRAKLAGALNSLTAVFFTKIDDILYTCRDFVYQGLKVSLHMPSRIPRPSQVYFNVGLDKITTGVILPTLMSTSKSVESTPPEVRNCFFSKERKLAYFKYYSQNNCNMECNTNYTREVCGSPFCCLLHAKWSIQTKVDESDQLIEYELQYISSSNQILNQNETFSRRTNQHLSRAMSAGDKYTPICGPKKMACLDRALSALTIPETEVEIKAAEKRENCFCVPICVDLSYNVELSSGPFEKQDQLNTGKTLAQLEGYHAHVIKIFMKSSYFLPTFRQVMYGPMTFFEQTASLLGLFLGFSLVSLGEMICFFSIRIIENIRAGIMPMP
ncbi:hypothetical protein HHI36_015340 [Cryptolaemus montrouzieri]|uniref:Uncharacterized protein n=1 Tax=Cryptolaemus montrouzieri TaxID=559131 RepID=A0ABD2N5B6_9CUCU